MLLKLMLLGRKPQQAREDVPLCKWLCNQGPFQDEAEVSEQGRVIYCILAGRPTGQ